MSESVNRTRTSDADLDATVAWLAEHPALLEPFVGQWVAVADERVIAHGHSVVDVTEDAARLGYPDPLLVPVMPPDFATIQARAGLFAHPLRAPRPQPRRDFVGSARAFSPAPSVSTPRRRFQPPRRRLRPRERRPAPRLSPLSRARDRGRG